MSDIPDTVLGKIQFFEQHIPVWAADPAAIGLSAQQIIDITSFTVAARSGYNNAQATRQIARSATLGQNEGVDGMMTFGTAVIATIKAFADISGDGPAVYIAAQISPDDNPSPLAPPAMATDLRADLVNSGAIRLRWKGTIAHGTFYTIWRRLDSETEYDILGSVSAKKFVDDTLPVGTPEANYFLITHRDELKSDPTEPIAVRFGVVGTAGTGEATGEGEGGDLNIAA